MFSICTLLSENSAVSELEKNAEKPSRTYEQRQLDPESQVQDQIASKVRPENRSGAL